MPFGPYASFDDCVRKNKDKRNPRGYCAEVERKIKERRKRKAKSKKKGS